MLKEPTLFGAVANNLFAEARLPLSVVLWVLWCIKQSGSKLQRNLRHSVERTCGC